MNWRSRPAVDPPAEQTAAGGFARDVLPHLDSAYNLARWLVRDATLAEDVVQDAMLRALGAFASLRGSDARPWLMRIVRNVAYDMVAARRRGGAQFPGTGTGCDEEALRALADPSDTPEAALTRSQEIAQLHRALAALPVELRECLVLRELEGLAYKEIAHIAGVPIGTVMSRLWRARRALLGERLESLGHDR